MDRALKGYSTKGGVKYELVEFVTGGEGRTLGFLAADAKSSEDQEKMHDKMIETCVKSVNGSKENILETVKNLRLMDYKEIVDSITSLFVGMDEQKKTA